LHNFPQHFSSDSDVGSAACPINNGPKLYNAQVPGPSIVCCPFLGETRKRRKKKNQKNYYSRL